MKDWVTWIVLALVGLCFYQNMKMSEKIAIIFKQNTGIVHLLRDGVCE